MSFTNSACRTRVKDDCTKFVYLIPGVDMGDVKVTYLNGVFKMSAHRGPHYNYDMELHIDTTRFNPYKANAYVDRGVLTLVVPYGHAVNNGFDVPISMG